MCIHFFKKLFSIMHGVSFMIQRKILIWAFIFSTQFATFLINFAKTHNLMLDFILNIIFCLWFSYVMAEVKFFHAWFEFFQSYRSRDRKETLKCDVCEYKTCNKSRLKDKSSVNLIMIDSKFTCKKSMVHEIFNINV